MNIILNYGSILVDVMEASRRHDLATGGAPETILIDRRADPAQQLRTTTLHVSHIKSFNTKVQFQISTMGRAGGNADNKLRGYKAYV